MIVNDVNVVNHDNAVVFVTEKELIDGGPTTFLYYSTSGKF